MIKPLPAVALNSSTYVAIPVPSNPAVKTFILQCDSAIDVSISDTSSGTNNYTIKSGASLAIEVVPFTKDESDYTICYAKSASATPKMQILQVD